MTCIVSHPTKKALRVAILLDPSHVLIEDPSIVRPRQLTAAEIKEGESLMVTNHPKRSWFGSIARRNGTLVVE